MSDDSTAASASESPAARPTRLARAEVRLADWRDEAAAVERDAALMKWILRIGLPASLVALWWSAWIMLLAAAIVVLAWCMGQYMVRVRRAEFAQHVRDAEQEVRRIRGGG
jgi:hypothetical protein